MSNEARGEFLELCYTPPEFDIELCYEVVERITVKTTMDQDDACRLGVNITTSIGFICSAFEYGFVNEINARIGSNDYAIRVFMSKDNQRKI